MNWTPEAIALSDKWDTMRLDIGAVTFDQFFVFMRRIGEVANGVTSVWWSGDLNGEFRSFEPYYTIGSFDGADFCYRYSDQTASKLATANDGRIAGLAFVDIDGTEKYLFCPRDPYTFAVLQEFPANTFDLRARSLRDIAETLTDDDDEIEAISDTTRDYVAMSTVSGWMTAPNQIIGEIPSNQARAFIASHIPSSLNGSCLTCGQDTHWNWFRTEFICDDCAVPATTICPVCDNEPEAGVVPCPRCSGTGRSVPTRLRCPCCGRAFTPDGSATTLCDLCAWAMRQSYLARLAEDSFVDTRERYLSRRLARQRIICVDNRSAESNWQTVNARARRARIQRENEAALAARRISVLIDRSVPIPTPSDLQCDSTSAGVSFGVEIECFINENLADAENVSVGGYHYGRRVPGFEGWKAERDGSLEEDRGTGDSHICCEFVSPILYGAEGLESVRRMCAFINNKLGGYANESCGLHVHIGVDSGRGSAGRYQWIGRLVSLVQRAEESLWGITGSTRRAGIVSSIPRGSHWAKSIKTASHVELVETCLNSNESDYAKERAVDRTDRYNVLNLNNVGNSKDTVELRYGDGTTSFSQIAAYVGVAVGLAVIARAPSRGRGATWFSPTVSEWKIRNSWKGGRFGGHVDRLLRKLGWVRAGQTTPRIGWMGSEAQLKATRRLMRANAEAIDTEIQARG